MVSWTPSRTQDPLDSAMGWQFGAVVGPSRDELLAAVGPDGLAVDRPLSGHLARAPRLTTDHETPALEHNVAATLVANGGRVAVANVRSAT